MKKLLALGITLFASGGLLVGCQSSTASQSSKTTATQSTKTVKKVSQETPPKSAMTTVLAPLTAKLPEDQSTQTGNRSTYSQFYYRHHNWHWTLSKTDGQTIASGKVQTMTSDQGLGDHTLKMVANNGDDFTLTLTRSPKQQYYQVKTAYKNIGGTYILGDNDKGWTAGVPSSLAGTWTTDFYTPQSPDANKVVYQRTRMLLSTGGFEEITSSFDKNHTYLPDLAGCGAGVNDHPCYQQQVDGTYLYKTYSGGRLWLVMRVTPDKQGLKTTNDGKTEIFTKKVSTGTLLTLGMAQSSATNLTPHQVKVWAYRHGLQTYDLDKLSIESNSEGLDKNGEYSFMIREDRGDHTSIVCNGKVTKKGVLEIQYDFGKHYEPVSDDPAY